MWISSEHSEREPKHCLDCHKINVPPAEWKLKGEQWQYAPRTSRQIWERPRIPFNDDHRWWSKVGLRVQPRNQATDVSVEEPKICTPKKGKTNLPKCKQHTYWFFKHVWTCSITNLFHKEKRKPTLQHRYLKLSAAGKEAKKTTWKVGFRGLVSPPWQCTC